MAIINGTPGNDYLTGTEQADEIYGYEGNDQLIGGSGNDILIGGPGNDYLVGGPGDDILTGGEGKDTFKLYFSGGGIDTLTNYNVREDSIDLTSTSNRLLTDLLTLGSTRPGFEASSRYLSYDPIHGALFYLSQQIAWLPTGLNPNQVIESIKV